ARLLDSEALRRKAFQETGPVLPTTFAEPPFHMRMRMDAMANFLACHRVAEATAILDGARQAMPTLQVTLNGVAHDGFHDADDLFGSVLEVMNDGLYYWLPL